MATSEMGSTRRLYDCKDHHGLGLNGLSEMMESPVFDDSKLIWLGMCEVLACKKATCIIDISASLFSIGDLTKLFVNPE